MRLIKRRPKASQRRAAAQSGLVGADGKIMAVMAQVIDVPAITRAVRKTE
jgi:hypothetical protein